MGGEVLRGRTPCGRSIDSCSLLQNGENCKHQLEEHLDRCGKLSFDMALESQSRMDHYRHGFSRILVRENQQK